MIEIRLASESDAETLARLRYELRSSLHEVAENEETFLARCAAWMNDRLRQEGEVLKQLRHQHVVGPQLPLEQVERREVADGRHRGTSARAHAVFDIGVTSVVQTRRVPVGLAASASFTRRGRK